MLSSNRILGAAFIFLSLPAQASVGQENSQVVLLVQQLQISQSTDIAAEHLLGAAKSDLQTRLYLARQLPSIIQEGPKDPIQPWLNAVRLAGELQIAEASAALAEWIGFRTGGTLSLGQWARLEYNPAAKALAQIGDPALNSIKAVLQRRALQERQLAVQTLIMIASPAARALFRNHVSQEPDLELKRSMERTLEAWQQAGSHCSCDVIQHALDDFDQIRVGLTRQVLERHKFVGGSGLSSRDRTSYSYESCGDIQLQVEFSRDPNVLGDQNYSPNDVITKISTLSLRNPAAD